MASGVCYSVTVLALADADSLYFAAGPEDEADGVFGRLRVATVPEPSTASGTVIALLSFWGLRRLNHKRRKSCST